MTRSLIDRDSLDQLFHQKVCWVRFWLVAPLGANMIRQDDIITDVLTWDMTRHEWSAQVSSVACGPCTGSFTNVHKTPESWSELATKRCYLKHCPQLLETLCGSRVINDYITQMSLVSVRHRNSNGLHNRLRRRDFSMQHSTMHWNILKSIENYL